VAAQLEAGVDDPLRRREGVLAVGRYLRPFHRVLEHGSVEQPLEDRLVADRVGAAGGAAITATGVDEFVVVLLPNCPAAFNPQQLIDPDVNNAHEESSPTGLLGPAALTAATPDNRFELEVEPTANTRTGVREFVVVLFPNCPLELDPQQFTKPVVNNAQVCEPPAEIDDRSVIEPEPPTAVTCTGLDEFVVELFPNCPELFTPQQVTKPVLNNAQV
jgi:hypothetical protein